MSPRRRRAQRVEHPAELLRQLRVVDVPAQLGVGETRLDGGDPDVARAELGAQGAESWVSAAFVAPYTA